MFEMHGHTPAVRDETTWRVLTGALCLLFKTCPSHGSMALSTVFVPLGLMTCRETIDFSSTPLSLITQSTLGIDRCDARSVNFVSWRQNVLLRTGKKRKTSTIHANSPVNKKGSLLLSTPFPLVK